jgi:hypothetical protein
LGPVPLEEVVRVPDERKREIVAEERKLAEQGLLASRVASKMLVWSMESRDPVIVVYHLGSGEQPIAQPSGAGLEPYPALRREAIDPALNYFARYAGVSFERRDGPLPPSPLDRRTLVLRYSTNAARYSNGSALPEFDITMNLYAPGEVYPHPDKFGYGGVEDRVIGSAPYSISSSEISSSDSSEENFSAMRFEFARRMLLNDLARTYELAPP